MTIDPKDGAVLFDTKDDAQKIIDLMTSDPFNNGVEYLILKVKEE